MQDNRKKLIGLIVITLLAIAGTGAAIALTSQKTETVSMPSHHTPNSPSSMTHGSYKSGTYSADGAYVSPGGDEHIGVTITLKGDVVESVSITTHGIAEAAQYQGMFKNGIGSHVIGKKIDEISVSRVSGSSLTSTGFNDALARIKDQAKA